MRLFCRAMTTASVCSKRCISLNVDESRQLEGRKKFRPDIESKAENRGPESSSNQAEQYSAFKRVFKKFKARSRPPDLAAVLDPRLPELHEQKSILPFPLIEPGLGEEEFEELGLRPFQEWRAVTFHDRPGLILLPDVFTQTGRNRWLLRCAKDYPNPPNVTNLDSFLPDDEKGLPWVITKSLGKVRWVTLGYHYDWKDKVYTEAARTEMPSDLVKLSASIAKALNFPEFMPETAILNYYQKNSTLSGHIDQSEWNLNPPLLSFSFGNPAIYLQGGLSLDEEPLPILLRDGDVMVMHGGQRLVYHGVPKVIGHECDIPERAVWPEISQEDYLGIRSFLEYGRINITVRQMQ